VAGVQTCALPIWARASEVGDPGQAKTHASGIGDPGRAKAHASGIGDRVPAHGLGAGLRLIGRAIREEPRVFAIAVAGSTAFGALTVASAVVVGEVVGRVVVPSNDSRRTVTAAKSSS